MHSESATFLVYLQFVEYFLCQLDVFEEVETLESSFVRFTRFSDRDKSLLAASSSKSISDRKKSRFRFFFELSNQTVHCSLSNNTC